VLFCEFNFLIIVFTVILMSIVVNINTSLHLVLTAEFLWITLYSIVLLMGFLSNNVNLVSLTFFFLILSAAEFSIGLVLILIQFIFTRSITLNNTPHNSMKFVSRFTTRLNINNFKF